MDQSLYVKLSDQIARQTPELAAYDADIAARTATVDALKAALDAAQADYDAADEADKPASQEALTAAQQAHAGPRSELDEVIARAAAIRASIAQCQSLIDGSGTTMTAQQVADAKLADTRAAIWERIKAHRDDLKGKGVKVGDHWFHSDASSRIQQLGLVMMAASVPPVPWKTLSGEFVPMSQALAMQIFQATAASDMAIFSAAETHRAAMNTDPTQANYDFSAGWPASFTG